MPKFISEEELDNPVVPFPITEEDILEYDEAGNQVLRYRRIKGIGYQVIPDVVREASLFEIVPEHLWKARREELLLKKGL